MKALDHCRYHGHYPGHWRNAFLEAIEAYRDWKPGQPEPTIEMELHYQTVHVPMSRVFGKLCHVLPGPILINLPTMALNQNAALMRPQPGRY